MKSLLDKIKILKINIFFKNILYLFRYSVKDDVANKIYWVQQEFEYELRKIKKELIYHKMMDYYRNNPPVSFIQEIEYIKKEGQVSFFPYKRIKTLSKVASGFDSQNQMPYVIHGTNKKLYFPKNWSVERAQNTYLDYIQIENILGGEFLERSPHQYQSKNICVREGDLVIDIGSAEALFALDVVDIARKVIIIEADKIWKEPLMATFEPYKDKVKIINKRLSNRDSNYEIKLDTCLEDEVLDNIFVKMDIEGYETTLIEDNEWLLQKNINLSIVCCTYHKQNDAEILSYFFKKNGLYTEFSDGNILFYIDERIEPPFFRKGIIRANRTKE
ncbi:hypothetical protein [Runella aurantiaca]|uniref:FkbM family methyltransferase n=1 Tax=Runella aurantiaca TaxID=2282308 RepID=A0A369I9Y5_9BACT|nr:hypothetical protein [Runella aurantiaca]RDB04343.1 hypothetical protein DVG78_19290 [Runella aurantiaca]